MYNTVTKFEYGNEIHGAVFVKNHSALRNPKVHDRLHRNPLMHSYLDSFHSSSHLTPCPC